MAAPTGALTALSLMINNSKIAAGIAMIAMNFGSRFVVTDVSKFQEQVLQSALAKQFVLLCIFFVATRDIMIAFMMTAAFYVVVFGLFNENKKYNVLGRVVHPFASVYNMYERVTRQTKI